MNKHIINSLSEYNFTFDKNYGFAYYEDRDNGEIFEFMKKYCWKNF